jgi:hypothetical protein
MMLMSLLAPFAINGVIPLATLFVKCAQHEHAIHNADADANWQAEAKQQRVIHSLTVARHYSPVNGVGKFGICH